jgi:hypothetical protein
LNAIRCADFCPTPGKHLKASINCASKGEYDSVILVQKGSFMPSGNDKPPVTEAIRA